MLRVNPPPIKLSEYTNEDSEGNLMLKYHAYKTQSDGFVYIEVSSVGADYLMGYVGDTSDPIGEGDNVRSTREVISGYSKIGFIVFRDKYFEIVWAGATVCDIQWRSVGYLKKPIDFN